MRKKKWLDKICFRDSFKSGMIGKVRFSVIGVLWTPVARVESEIGITTEGNANLYND